MPTLPTTRTIANTAAEHVADHNTVHGFNNTHPTDAAAHSGTYVRQAGVLVDVTDSPYNADKTGVADARAAINSAIDAVNTAGGGTVFLPAGTYKISTSPGIVLKANVTLEGAGPGTVISQAYWPGLFSGTINASGTYTDADVTTLTANASSGVNTLTVTSTASLTAGSYYLLGADKAFADAPASPSNDELRYRGEIVRISSIDSGTQVTIYGRTRDLYETTNAASLKAITFLDGVSLRHFQVTNSAPAANTSDAIKLSYCRRFEIEDVSCNQIDGVGIHFDMCLAGSIRGGRMLDLTDDIANSRYGYGILANRATEDITIVGLRVERGRHGFTTNGVNNKRGVPRNITLVNCVSDRSSDSAWDTHAQGAGISFVGCRATNCPATGFNIRSADTTVQGSATSFCNRGAYLVSPAAGAQILGNSFRKNYGGTGLGIQLDTVQQCTVADNTIDGSFVEAIRLDLGAKNNIIRGNRLVNPGNTTSGPGIKVASTATASCTGNQIVDNLLVSFSAASNEARSTGQMTNAIDIQSSSAASFYIAGNRAVGATAALFVKDSGSGSTKRDNLHLDRNEDETAAFLPTGAVTETYSRRGGGIASQAFLTSGRQSFIATYLKAGDVVTSITFISGGTAAATPTNQWFSLYDINRAKLAVTVDDTTTAWGTFAAKTLNLSSPYTVPSSGLYYLGIMVAAATVPSIGGQTVSGTATQTAPITCAIDSTNTGLTTPATAPATATFASLGVAVWAYAS